MFLLLRLMRVASASGDPSRIARRRKCMRWTRMSESPEIKWHAKNCSHYNLVSELRSPETNYCYFPLPEGVLRNKKRHPPPHVDVSDARPLILKAVRKIKCPPTA